MAAEEIPLRQIGKALAAEEAVLREQGVTERSRATVAIIVDAARVAVLDPIVDLFAAVEPCRVFVLVPDPRRKVPAAASVRARGVQLANERVSSVEMIELRYAPAERELIVQVIKEYSVPGRARKMLFFTSDLEVEDAKRYARLAEELYFDSHLFPAALGLVESGLVKVRDTVDLQWLALSPIRHQVRIAFAAPAAMAAIDAIARIEIAVPEEWEISWGYLVAGWVLDRLGLEPRSLGFSGFECSSVRPRRPPVLEVIRLAVVGEIAVSFFRVGESEPFVLVRQFHEDAGDRTMRAEVIYNGELQEGSVVRWQEESVITLLRRYLMIGESLKNYRRAAVLAQALKRLASAFAQAS